MIRKSSITATGTGLYLGGSSGQFEVAAFLIENNLIHGTLGYGVQIKHQLARNTSIGAPTSATTILRHNVFSKVNGSLSGIEARPNVLLGHWPLSGAGSTDSYQVYGNLFDENPYEALFQAEGHVALHDNLFVNRTGPAAVRFQKHNSLPRRLDVWNNTVVAAGTRISTASRGSTPSGGPTRAKARTRAGSRSWGSSRKGVKPGPSARPSPQPSPSLRPPTGRGLG